MQILSQFTCLTDGQTDGQTDRILIARPRLHSTQRGEKLNILTASVSTSVGSDCIFIGCHSVSV